MSQTNVPDSFFERELAGEQAPSLATMGELFSVSSELFARSPWDTIGDAQLIKVESALSDEPSYCTVMGALGEVIGLHAYVGPDGLGLLRKILSGDRLVFDAIFTSRRGVSVEFVEVSELTPVDRKLLKALGHPLTRGRAAPQFRAFRPGYHPWYVTESEAALLVECIAAILAVDDVLKQGEDYWTSDNSMALASRVDGMPLRFHVEKVAARPPADSMPRMPGLDQRRVESIRALHLPKKRTLQTDHFYAPAEVGTRYQRKGCLRVAVVIDAETAYAFPPNVGSPEANTGEMLANAVLSAIETASVIPRNLQVRNREFKILLDPLAKALGFSVQVTPSLPALDFARDALLDMMLDSGSAPS